MKIISPKTGSLRSEAAAVALLLFLLVFPFNASYAQESGEAFSADLEAAWTGDFDGMLERRKIRVLIPYSKTFFFLDGGKKRGLAVELLREFEKAVRKDIKSKKRYPAIFLVPTRRDRLIEDLVEGRGDIAIANLTITEQRKEKVAFSAPFQKNVSELLVTPKLQRKRTGIMDLAGMTIHVRASSSYFHSLEAANVELKKAGKEPVNIVRANELLEDEDLLEMVNAELLPAIIVDSHKAAFWSGVFDNIQVHEDAAVRKDAQIAWAFRKDSPKLKARIDAFAKGAASGTMLGNMLLTRYYKNTGWLKKATSGANIKKLENLAIYFQKYGEEYQIDWLILAALAFHESQFNQKAKGPKGAIGIMQIKPSTAASPAVKVPNIRQVEANIHAGSKYLRYLADQYFPGNDVDEFNRILFALASYNAGPNRIKSLRGKSKNPNIWFDNVEDVVASQVGLIPVRYVLSIQEYYVAFKNFREGLDKRREALGDNKRGN